MFTVYKPLEAGIGTEQTTLSLQEEFELYNEYVNTPDKYKHKFICANLDKLNYISKYMDINYFLPLYLSYNFLENYLSEQIIENLIHGNSDKLIDITGFFSSRFNFNLDLIKTNFLKHHTKWPSTGPSGETIFTYGFTHKRLGIEKTHSNFLKSNGEFKIQGNKILCSLLNYQLLATANEFSDLSVYTKAFEKPNKMCYMCKKICPANIFFGTSKFMCYLCGCANYQMRSRKTHMGSIRAYVSGCRHTVGYSIALNILRNGGFVLGSTRFPNCARLNFISEPDYESFADRIKIIKCDYTKLSDIYELVGHIQSHQINTLINNAFQTVRQSPDYYSKANGLENELDKMDEISLSGDLITFMANNKININEHKNIGESRGLKTQWTQNLMETDTGEILECNMINQIAPTILFQKVIDTWVRTGSPEQKYYLINVSSTEAFHNTDHHIITSMNKIAMDNLIDRVRIGLPDNFVVYSADPGFVTGVRNDNEKPLDAHDGAIRVLEPLMSSLDGKNISNTNLVSAFYKDYTHIENINYKTKRCQLNQINL